MQIQWVRFSKSTFSYSILVSGAVPWLHVKESNHVVGHLSDQRSHWSSESM